MINSIEAHEIQGQLVAKARNENDESRAKFESDFHRRMMDLEVDHGDKTACRDAYQKGYKAERKPFPLRGEL